MWKGGGKYGNGEVESPVNGYFEELNVFTIYIEATEYQVYGVKRICWESNIFFQNFFFLFKV